MSEADAAIFVNNTVQGHASQFEEVDFLTVHPCHTMFRVGQTDEGDALVYPILLKG